MLADLSLVTALFAVAWIAAYPVSYFLTQAVATRVRRGEWNSRARRQFREGLPWLVLTLVPEIALIILRPRVIAAGVVLALLWAGSVFMTSRGRERAFSNDLLLVAMAATATPLMYWTAHPDSPWPGSVWRTSLVILIFFTGSVIHVKSLIREGDDPRWRIGNIVFHLLVLAIAFLAPIYLLAFVPTLVRSALLKPGVPAVRIGVIEIVMSALLLFAVALAN